MAAITPLNATPPLDATLAAVTEVQRLDVEAMHEKVRGILTTTHGGWLCAGAAGQKACRTVIEFYENVVYYLHWVQGFAVLCIIRIILYYILIRIMY